ncbi:hypothetical protein SEVIR_6G028800v4 [Setaria viridis]|uniref:At1g61320/AtMIF1 LRR domain-containing protein n=1 Tax=Setaria viridis TaxID=4556 RepID=A0A4U6UDI6_SETVI|nr:uncharacterized protein LOC117859961 [Setaria viridis]TKW08457.1 hypothetical protein SEVIR_6G028800v2 [Setaria viridis]
MPPKDAAAQGAPGGGDRLSGLRDEILLRVMGHLKAWEAVRTCALSTRWRNLWASASRLDIRHPWPCCLLAADDQVPVVEAFAAADQVLAETFAVADQVLAETFAAFVKNLLLRRLPLAQLDSLRLCWSHEAPDGNANFWIAYAVRHGAEEIELSAEHHFPKPSPQYMRFIVDGDEDANYRLKILKLIHVRLGGTTLTQLCSRCALLRELELQDCDIPYETKIQPILLERLTMIRCQIMRPLSVYAPNLVALQFSGNLGYVPWIQNLGLLAASNIKQQAEAPHYNYSEGSSLGSWDLKILKLSHVHLDDTILRQICSRCTSLEELELKNCSIDGEEIGSTSLKYLTMISCKFSIAFRVQAPNLALLRCIKPFQHFPLIQKMEFLVTATIVLDDYCLLPDCQWLQEEDDSDDNSNDDYDNYFGDNKSNESDGSSNYYDSDRSASSDEEDDGRTVGYGEISKEHKHKPYKYLINGHKRRADEPMENFYGKHGSDNFGGVGMLLGLSDVKTMDLLAHPGEVLLTRELKSCTDFKNLKTLSLGEWCITPRFDVLAAMLGHSPNLEILFLHLDMAYNSRVGFNLWASSFECTNLKTVNITCCKHDVMVHTLADFFSENSIPNDKIFVRRTPCSGCTGGTSSQAKRKAQSEAEKREAKRMKIGN